VAKQRKPKLKVRKLAPCGPVDVAAVWKRIEAAVGTLAPAIIRNFAPGATAKQIRDFEKAIGRKLPEEVRQSFRSHDGERDVGPPFFIHGITFGSLAWALGAWNSWGWADHQEERGFERPMRELLILYGSTPKDAIQLRYASRNWVPLVDIGQPNYFGLDFDPGPKGLPGQVINFGRDEKLKVVWAWSWGWFLNDLAEELEAGNFRFSEDEDRLFLIDPDPPHDCFFNLSGEWSKAKATGRRPFDPLHPEVLKPLQADTTVKQLARVIAKNCDFGSLPILADALEEAGCTDKRLLMHCRNPGEHGCGCWAVNLLLGEAPQFVDSQ
jgi:cell wall assembly regulator SMI1